MDLRERAELVDRYFVRPPSSPARVFPIVTILAGSVLNVTSAFLLQRSWSTLAPYAVLVTLSGIGICVMVVGAAYLISNERDYRQGMAAAFPRASDEQMEAWLDEAVGHAIKNALGRLNLHPDDVRDSVGGPAMLWFTGVPDFRKWEADVARGKDGRIRFSIYPILIAFLSGWRLSTYECIYSMRTGFFLTEVRKEYHLRQSDGLEIASDRVSIPLSVAVHADRPEGDDTDVAEVPEAHQVTLTSMQELVLMVSGREAVTLNMSFDLDDRFHIEGNPRSRNDEFIALLRDHFRHHMGGFTEGSDLPQRAGDGVERDGANGAFVARSVESIVGSLRERIATGHVAVAAMLVTAAGSEIPLDDGPQADTIGICRTRGIPFDELLGVKAEMNAVAVMAVRRLAVASLILVGRGPMDEESRDAIERLLSRGSQLHLFFEGQYVSSYFGTWEDNAQVIDV